MIGTANQRNIKVVMLGVPKPKLFLMDSAEIYHRIAEQHNTPIDLETLPTLLGNNQLRNVHETTSRFLTCLFAPDGMVSFVA